MVTNNLETILELPRDVLNEHKAPLEESAMATQEKDRACNDLVRKLTMGESLEDAEKSHLAVCEACMAEVVKALDEAAKGGSQGSGKFPNLANGELSPVRPEAMRALEQGRRVFEREFGISLPKK